MNEDDVWQGPDVNGWGQSGSKRMQQTAALCVSSDCGLSDSGMVEHGVPLAAYTAVP